MRFPLRVVGAAFVDIADRHALHIRFAQEVQHHAQTLVSYANERHVDLVAGRNISRATQHASRHDGKAHRRCGTLFQEGAPRIFALQKFLRLYLLFHGSP